MYKWYDYAANHFSDYKLIAKSDDDVYLCPDKLMEDLNGNEVKSHWHNLYYGWSWFQGAMKPLPYPEEEQIKQIVPLTQKEFDKKFNKEAIIKRYTNTNIISHNADNPDGLGHWIVSDYKAFRKICNNTFPCNKNNPQGYEPISAFQRHDEFFVILAMPLVKKIISKPYCRRQNKTMCTNDNERYDNDFAGQSLGIWLGEIQKKNPEDVFLMRRNRLFVHYADAIHDIREVRQTMQKMNGDEYNFCKDFAIFHKSSTELTRWLYQKTLDFEKV